MSVPLLTWSDGACMYCSCSDNGEISARVFYIARRQATSVNGYHSYAPLEATDAALPYRKFVVRRLILNITKGFSPKLAESHPVISAACADSLSFVPPPSVQLAPCRVKVPPVSVYQYVPWMSLVPTVTHVDDLPHSKRVRSYVR